MNIFEYLGNLNVSEECFDEIIGIVEEILNEAGYGATLTQNKLDSKVKNAVESRKDALQNALDNPGTSPKEASRLKMRLHRANVLNHNGMLGNKKTVRSNALKAAFGENPTIDTLKNAKEVPEVASCYIREIKNLGKPESEKNSPNVENVRVQGGLNGKC